MSFSTISLIGLIISFYALLFNGKLHSDFMLVVAAVTGIVGLPTLIYLMWLSPWGWWFAGVYAWMFCFNFHLINEDNMLIAAIVYIILIIIPVWYARGLY